MLKKMIAAIFAVGMSLVLMGSAVGLASAAPATEGYDCPGGSFCGWEDEDGRGSMVVQVDSRCVVHDIGNAGVGDRVTSVSNRTGTTVELLDWGTDSWVVLTSLSDGSRGNLPPWLDDRTDAVKVCA